MTGGASGIENCPTLQGGVEKTNMEPLLNKLILDGAINTFGGQMPDAQQLWNAASFDFQKSGDYITANGQIYYDIKDLNMPQIENIVRQKVNSQFGLDNSIGIVFNDSSSLSKTIEKSPEFNSFINKNSQNLLNGKTINDSLSFTDDPNLHNALGKVDILRTRINEYGELEALVLDTYDFNEGSKNIFVRMGRKAQNAGLLTPYYTIVRIRVPLSINK